MYLPMKVKNIYQKIVMVHPDISLQEPHQTCCKEMTLTVHVHDSIGIFVDTAFQRQMQSIHKSNGYSVPIPRSTIQNLASTFTV